MLRAMPFFSLSPRAVRSPEREWGLRDWVAGVALFAATAGVVLWQNSHVAVLFDLSYILNTATRIAQGQVPYRDFPLAHAPLTFLIQAAIIRLTGRVFFHHVLYVAFVGGMGTVLAWRVALDTLRGRVRAAWTVALLVAAPLIFVGIYCIVPNPEYDCDCAFSILVAVWLLQKVDAKTSATLGFTAGAFACVPLFFKQNMGLPFLVTALGAVLLVPAINRLGQGTPESAPETRLLFSVLAGAGVALLAAVLALHWTAGLGNYLQWTIQYAGQRRMPGVSHMLGVYRDPTLLWTLPCVAAALILLRAGIGKELWARIVAFALLAAPFVWTLASLLRFDDADERGDALLALWPLVLVLAAALALANLFALRRRGPRGQVFVRGVGAAVLAPVSAARSIGRHSRHVSVATALGIDLRHLADARLADCGTAGISCGIFAACIRFASGLFRRSPRLLPSRSLSAEGFYTVSEERLSYANLPDGPAAHSAFPELAGLATPGPYVPEIDELLRYAQANIPFDDGIVLIPGEEPFYFATGRVPQFPVPFFDPTIDPYSPAEIAALVRARNIRWLIVKTDVQTKEDPTPDRAELMDALLMQEFTTAAHLRGYEVYRR